MKPIITLSLLFISLSVFSQNRVIGSLLQEEEGVPFANVILKNATDSSIAKVEFSDDLGSFELIGFQDGSYFVEASAVGINPYFSAVFEANGQTIDLGQMVMNSEGNQLAEVTVTAAKPLVEVLPDRTVFNVSTSESNIGNNGMELLRKAPGVVIDNNNNILLQGRSGVRVFINNKPSPLLGADLVAYLEGLQSSDIEAIEIITDPSSKYEAEGNAGIINIRLKKDSNLGTNGSLGLGWQVGTFAKYNGNLSLNHNVKGANFFASVSGNMGNWENKFGFDRRQNGIQLLIDNVSISENKNMNFRTGVDLNLGKNSTLGLLVHGNLSDNVWNNTSLTNIFDMESGQPIENLNATNRMPSERRNLNYNINYQYRKDDILWNVDADYGTFNNDNYSVQPNLYSYPEGGRPDTSINYESAAPTDIQIVTAKIDHERNIGNWKLETGLKFSDITTDNEYTFFSATRTGLVLDDNRSNDFKYSENVNAAYINLSQKGEKWGYQLGLRAEQTNSEGMLYNTEGRLQEQNTRTYTDFFPSGGLTYNYNPLNTFRLTFSRRIDRPNYEDLNPFEFKLNELSYRKGNPFLNPQYTNSVQLAWTHKHTWNFSMAYAKTNDMFAEIVDTVSQKESFIRKENLANQDNISFNFSKPLTITKWWSNFTNIGAFYSLYNAEFETGQVIDINNFSVNIFSQQTFTLSPKVSAELSGFYNSPGIWGGSFYTREMWALDAGVTVKVLDNKGSLKFALSDIFFSQQWGGYSNYGGIRMDGGGQWESRRFRVNFTYNFGNEKVKSRNRKTGIEAESKRAASSN